MAVKTKSASVPKAFNRWLMKQYRHSIGQLIVLVLISLLSIAVLLMTPWPLKVLVDSVFGHIAAPGILSRLSRSQLLALVGAAYVVIYMASGIIGILDQYLTTKFSLRLGLKLKNNFFNHILSMNRLVRREVQSGDYVYRLNQEVDYLPTLMLSTTTSLITNLITILAAAVVLYVLNAQLALYSLLIVPLLYVSIRVFTPRIGLLSSNIETASSKIYNHSTESIDKVEIVQAFNREKVQTKQLETLIAQQNALELKLTVLESGFEFSNNLFTSIGVGIVVVLGGHLALNGALTLGELLIFVTYMSYFYDPLEGVVSGIGSFRSLTAGLVRVHDILVLPKSAKHFGRRLNLPDKIKGHIQFENVSFKYDDTEVLTAVNLEVKAGEKVALIGQSGSGKSTLLSLLLGYVEADSGSIKIDGHDINNINIHSLRQNIAVVTQESALFSGTIGDNIAFSKPELSNEAAVLEAADSANATEFIAHTRQQFNTDIGESGDNLSGGQKQRVSIARAFFKDGPILILDEPTSSQDTESGQKIVSAVKVLMKHKTVLMISHELSLLKEMDAVYVVQDGTIKHVNEYGGLENYIYRLITKPPLNDGL